MTSEQWQHHPKVVLVPIHDHCTEWSTHWITFTPRKPTDFVLTISTVSLSPELNTADVVDAFPHCALMQWIRIEPWQLKPLQTLCVCHISVLSLRRRSRMLFWFSGEQTPLWKSFHLKAAWCSKCRLELRIVPTYKWTGTGDVHMRMQ